MRYIRKIMLSALLFLLLFSITAAAAEKKGWYTSTKGAVYYYVKGEKTLGWKKISKKWYYFDEKTGKCQKNKWIDDCYVGSDGVRVSGLNKIKKKWYYFSKADGKVQKNVITGNKTDGYFYVGEDGIRVTDQNIQQAVKIVQTVTKASQTPEQKLKACFEYFAGPRCAYVHYDQSGKMTKMPEYASRMLMLGKGNCYCFASALAYCAKVLGFECGVGAGGVTARGPQASLSAHGWTQVEMDGKTYMYDLSMHRSYIKRGISLKHIEWGKYPFRIRRNHSYAIRAEGGKVYWEDITKKK